MEDVRLGFVGAGYMGQLAHLANYDQIDDCSVVALGEPRTTLATRVAQRYDIPAVYDGYQSMLEEAELDALVAAQPYDRYAAIVPDLLEAGIPLFTEKPVAVNPGTADELASLAERADIPYMVGYHKRSDPAMVSAKQVVNQWRDSGEYGTLRYVRITIPEGDWIAGAPSPITTDEEPPQAEMEPLPADLDDEVAEAYNAFINYYIHQVNALRFFFDEPYDVSYADTDGRLLIAESESGVTGTIELSPYQISTGWHESILVGFDHGSVRIALPAPLESQRAGRVEVMRDDGDGEQQTTRPAMPPKSAMRAQAENFIAVVRGERDPPCDVTEGALDLHVARAYIARRWGQ